MSKLKGVSMAIRVVYEEDNEGVYVYHKGKCVYHIPDYDVPDEVLDSGDEQYLFDYVMEHYSDDISECIEAYTYKSE